MQGLHFESYDDNILPPVIKKEMWNADPADKGHITVYLVSYADKKIVAHLSALKDFRFQVFSKEVKEKVKAGNITFLPVNKTLFNESLINCSAVITGAGFETPAEALHLDKKLMVIPIKGQYEQQCNAAALQRYGVTALEKIDENFTAEFQKWISGNEQIAVRYTKDSRRIITNMMEKAMLPDRNENLIFTPDELSWY